MMQEYLKRFFSYAHWANSVACDGIEQLPQDSPQRAQAIKLMSHILNATELWRRSRLLHEPMPSAGAWPELTLEECRAKNDAEAKAWEAYLASSSDGALQSQLEYTNLAGDPFTNSVQDIVHHVANHATHHRGQIMQLVRQGGGTPASTDFIAWVRLMSANA